MFGGACGFERYGTDLHPPMAKSEPEASVYSLVDGLGTRMGPFGMIQHRKMGLKITKNPKPADIADFRPVCNYPDCLDHDLYADSGLCTP